MHSLLNIVPTSKQRFVAVAVGFCCAMLAGAADAAVNGMTPAEFTNTGEVFPSAVQFETSTANNQASVVVLPKGMAITKTADASALSSPIAAGDTITYTITARNLGLLGLTNVTVDDSIIPASNVTLISGDSNSDNVLDADELWTWQGVYQVTQADIDTNGGGDGDIDNTVTVDTAELPPMTESATVPVTQEPSFTVAKVVDQASISAPSVLNYTVTVSNTGNQTLSGIAVTDLLPDGSVASMTGPIADIGQAGLLDPGESWQFTTTYNALQSDIDADSDLINNVSVVTAQTGTDAQTDSVLTEVVFEPGFTVTKAVDQATLSAPGTLAYTVTVENTGNVVLTGVSLSDTLPDATAGTLTGPASDTGTAGALDTAETWAYTATFPVSQSQIDAGLDLVNRIDVVTNETGPDAQTAQAVTTVDQTPEFAVTKVVDVANIAAPGVVTYNMEVENTGNVTLTNIVLADQVSNGATPVLSGPVNDAGTVGALDIGEVWQYSATYAVTQTDVNLGADLVNTLSVVTDETGATPQVATATTVVDSAPALAVTKTVDIASIDTPGVLSYTIEVANTGNVTLTNVTPIDTLPDGTVGSLTGPIADTGASGVLDVGETWQFLTVYVVSQEDIDAGLVRTNTVEVTSAETGIDPFTATASTTIDTLPAFSVVKTVDQPEITTVSTLGYSIVVTNTGNTTLNNIALTDTLPDGTAAVLSGPTGDVGTAGALDVGESWTYGSAYSATQADIDSGNALVNSVSVTTDEAGTQTDTAVTNIAQLPSIMITKVAVDTEYTLAGDTINYAFLVANTGNLVLTNVALTDPNADSGTLRCLPPGQPVSAQLSLGPYTMQPGEQMNCTAVHTVTVADVLATKVDNQASVAAQDPQGNPVDALSEVITVQMNLLPPIATDDHFNSPTSGVPVTLAGGANDTDLNLDKYRATVTLLDANATDSDGDGDADTLIVAGEGTWTVDNTSGKVTFVPEPGFTADPTPVRYTVSDRSGLVSNEAVLSINYPQTAPVAEDDVKSNPSSPSPQNPTVVNVLADNGNGADSDIENDLVASTVVFTDPNAIDGDGDGDADTLSVAGEGGWVIDNTTGEVTFTPIAGFMADPTPVTYTVSDATGLVSNVATITVDYPQTAPFAVDDQRLDQPLAQPVLVAVLSNDSDPEDNLDPTTVMLIDPVAGTTVTVLPVAGEGVWQVDAVTGEITFTPNPGFIDDPTPVEYLVSDTTGIESNRAEIIITFEPPARIAGTVWLDSDRDGQVGADEDRKDGWTLHLINSDGDVVAATMTDSNGDYEFVDLIPGEYTIEFYNQTGVFMDSAQTQGPVLAGQVVQLPLPVDPSGVVYDSLERTVIEGVTLNLVNSQGVVVDESCLRENQQGQVTMADGFYAFDVAPDAHASCPDGDVYRIDVVDVPAAFHPNFSSIIRQEGAQQCGSSTIGCAVSSTFDSDPVELGCTVDAIDGSSACEVQAQPDAPQEGEDTRYYVEFELTSGDQNVIFNHLPLDARANDVAILLAKQADAKTTSIGSMLRYTITVENLKETPAVEIEVTDTPPAGFSYVSGSAQLLRAGIDTELNTQDDESVEIAAVVTGTFTFEKINIAPAEVVQISYLMRVGAGVTSGRYVNRAAAIGPNGEVSNDAVSGVDVIPDPALSQATLIGKVFVDRDEDGHQDNAHASGIKIVSDYFGVLDIPDLPARTSIGDDPARYAITLAMPVGRNNRFKIYTKEGTRVEVDENGTTIQAHVGLRARGYNSQNIRVCTRETASIPTMPDGSRGEQATDVLEIVITNLGIAEPGVPGARLATVDGLLIETDSYGRYNIPDVDSGAPGIGRNFILKVDPSSLIDGAHFTTENPAVMRIESSALNKMNFGIVAPEARDAYAVGCDPQLAAAYQKIEVNLGSVFFDTDDASIRDNQRGIVNDIIKTLRQYGGGEITIEAHTDSRASYEHNIKLAERRANSVRKLLMEALGRRVMSDVKVQVDPAAYRESE